MRAPLLALMISGCGAASLPLGSPPLADLQAEVADAKVDSGEPVVLTVRAVTADGWELQLSEPAADGLEASLSAQTGPVRDGERDVRTWTWELSGPDGSYVVSPGAGKATGPGGEIRDLQPPTVFVDIGVSGPSAGELADFAEVPLDQAPPWGLILAASGVGLALAGGLGWWAWRRAHQPVPPPPPDPPHVAALLAWERARLEIEDDHELAVALSRVLREYLEAILGWPATARTTREILVYLERQTHLGVVDRVRAQHVLDATDRLKFAREGGGTPFFDSLETDFRAVVDATRPTLGPEPALVDAATAVPPDHGGA